MEVVSGSGDGFVADEIVNQKCGVSRVQHFFALEFESSLRRRRFWRRRLHVWEQWHRGCRSLWNQRTQRHCLEDSLLARDAGILADHELVFITWLNQLPILHDAQEARITHDHLCSVVEVLKKELLKQDHTLTKVIYVYEKVLSADALATEKTKERMNNQLSHSKSQLPTHSLLRSSFP